MTKTQINKMIKAIEEREKAIAKERDKLDRIMQDAESLKECCERAEDSLQDARDALSELV